MMKPNTLSICFLAGAIAAGCAVDTGDDTTSEDTQASQSSELRPKHEHPVRGEGKTRGGGGGTNGISYHGGPVITGTANIHFIWYGNWSSNSAVGILDNLASSLGGSPYEHINTSYYNGSNVHVSGLISRAADASDNYSHGTALSDAAIEAIVAAQHPTDTNGIYMVLTSADVNETSGFCTQYCGWHDHATINGLDIKYAFVGNPDRCPNACEEQTTSPNANAGADGMASIISHESEEAISDPDLNAWYDRSGNENADKCAWTFGTESNASNGSKYNVTLGGSHYLIQQNWVNAGGGYCAMSY